MKIEKLKKLKNGKYKLYLSDGNTILTYDEIIINNMLFDGKELNNQLLSEISINNDYYEIYYKIVKLISNRLRSKKEILEFLNKNEVDKKIQEKIIQKLNQNGLIDDYKFALCYANDAINLRKNGPLKIKEDLRKLEISNEIIDQVIEKLDCEIIHENLINIVEKRNRLNKNNSLYMLKTKLSQELIKLGYKQDEIKEALKNLKSDDDIYKKECEKLMKKYSLKYSGNELKYKVRQGLYQKGFHPSEEIFFIDE